MVRVSVQFDINAFKRDLDAKGRKRVNKAAASALSRTATTVRKEASVSIRERLNISAAVAKKAITIRKMKGGLTVFIEAQGRPIPLRDFQARQTRSGVSFKVKRGGERKTYSSKYGPGFIITKIGGNVFVRAEPDPPGPKQAKVRKVYGPSVPQYFVTRAIRELLLRTARERWPIEFDRAWRALSRGP